jgi:DNA-binding transcriptional regulator YdaS (Cro superfamily)
MVWGMAKSPLEKALDIVGGQSALGRVLGTHQQNIWYWLHRTGRVPAEYVIPIEHATDGKVTRHELRPDIYPPEAVA